MLDWCGCSRHAGRFGASPPVTRVDRAAPVLPRDGGVPRSCSGSVRQPSSCCCGAMAVPARSWTRYAPPAPSQTLEHAVDQLGAEKAPVRLAVRAYLIRRSSHRPAVRLAVEAQLGGRHTATQAALKRPYRRRTAGPSARWWSGRAQLGCSEQTVQDRMTTTTTTEESHLDGRRNTMADRPRHVHAH